MSVVFTHTRNKECQEATHR